MWASAALVTIALAGIFFTGIYGQQRKINHLEKDIVRMYQQHNEIENGLNNNPVEVVFTSSIQEAEIQDEPNLVPNPSPEPSESIEEKVDEAEIEYDIHAVKTGDSLLEISYKHYQTVKMAKEIAELNELENQDTIYIGQKLKLPKVRR